MIENVLVLDPNFPLAAETRESLKSSIAAEARAS
jgi:hypothetical protein